MSKPLTVGALLRVLSNEDPKKIVVLASDSEGNEYNVLHYVSASNQAYSAKTREVGLLELTPAAIKLGHTDWDVLPKGKPAVVLYP